MASAAMAAAAVFPTMRGPVMSSWTEISLKKHEFCLIGPWDQTFQSKVRLFYLQNFKIMMRHSSPKFLKGAGCESCPQNSRHLNWNELISWCYSVTVTMIAKPGSQRRYCQRVWRRWSCWETGPLGQDRWGSFHWLNSPLPGGGLRSCLLSR